MHPWVVFTQGQSQLERILAAGMRHFIQETLVRNTGVGVCDRPPFMRQYAHLGRVVALYTVIGDGIGGAVGEHAERLLQAAVQTVDIHAVDHVGGIVFGVLHNGLADHGLVPRQWHSLVVQRAAHLVDEQWSIQAATNVLLARPDDLHGHIFAACSLDGLDGVVGIFAGPASEGAAHQGAVDHHRFFR